jgi:hypothetical protein
MLFPRLTRRRLAGCIFLALATLGAGAWWSLSSGRITRANYEAVMYGTSYDQVVAVFGPPEAETIAPPDSMFGPLRFYHWYRLRVEATFGFDAGGRCRLAGFEEYTAIQGARNWCQRCRTPMMPRPTGRPGHAPLVKRRPSAAEQSIPVILKDIDERGITKSGIYYRAVVVEF